MFEKQILQHFQFVSGHFQLNANKTLMAHIIIRSINLISDAIDSFEKSTKINKDGNYSIDINLKQVFDYLVERKLVKNTVQ